MIMYSGSYVINLFKQKVVSEKSDIVATVTLHNNLFVIDSLTSSPHKSSIHIYIEERYVYTLSQIKIYTV